MPGDEILKGKILFHMYNNLPLIVFSYQIDRLTKIIILDKFPNSIFSETKYEKMLFRIFDLFFHVEQPR